MLESMLEDGLINTVLKLAATRYFHENAQLTLGNL